MGGEEIEDRTGEGVAEEHVADLVGVGIPDPRALGQPPDLLQGAGQGGGVAGELHAGGVGEELPLAGDSGLDDIAQQHAEVAQDVERQADEEVGGAIVAAAIFGVTRRTGKAGRAHHEVADDRKHEDAIDQADQAEIETHVAVEHVAELVAQHALQFLAREIFQAAPRDGHHGVGGPKAGSEGVDRGLVVHHVDRRYRHSGGQRHFFHDVQEPALGQIGRLRIDEPAAHHVRDDLAAGGQLGDLIKASNRNDDGRAQGHRRQEPRVPEADRLRDVAAGPRGCPVAAALRDQHGDEVDRRDDHRHGNAEEDDQFEGLAPGAVLTFEEIHGHGNQPCRVGRVMRVPPSRDDSWWDSHHSAHPTLFPTT